MDKVTFEDLPRLVEDLIKRIEGLSEIVNMERQVDRRKPISIKEASQYLGMSESNLYTLVNKREITHYKKGRLYFYMDDLDSWVREGMVKTRGESKMEAIRSVASRMK